MRFSSTENVQSAGGQDDEMHACNALGHAGDNRPRTSLKRNSGFDFHICCSALLVQHRWRASAFTKPATGAGKDFTGLLSKGPARQLGWQRKWFSFLLKNFLNKGVTSPSSKALANNRVRMSSDSSATVTLGRSIPRGVYVDLTNFNTLSDSEE